MMATEQPEWVPGDPIYRKPGAVHETRPFYNIRDDSDSEECLPSCSDASTWPTPRPGRDLWRKPDELEAFIKEWHEWRETQDDPVSKSA